jgi:periplasmic protein TonB
MKHLVLITTCLLLSISTAFAQKADTNRTNPPSENDVVFTAVEVSPEFPGGYDAFGTFLSHNIHYPEMARHTGTQGRVIINFVVEKDGTLSEIKVVRGVGDGCDEEAVRVMKLSPKWKPGIQNGRPVRVYYTVPITFRLS